MGHREPSCGPGANWVLPAGAERPPGPRVDGAQVAHTFSPQSTRFQSQPSGARQPGEAAQDTERYAGGWRARGTGAWPIRVKICSHGLKQGRWAARLAVPGPSSAWGAGPLSSLCLTLCTGSSPEWPIMGEVGSETCTG